MMFRQLCALAVAIALVTAAAYAQEHAPAEDAPNQPPPQPRMTVKDFVTAAANGNMVEIQTGQMAQQKGSSDQVKDLGKRLVKDHEAAQEKLAAVAQSVGTALPTTLDDRHQKMVDQLSNHDKEAFDKAYLQAMAKDHMRTIRMYEQANQRTDNEALKNYTREMLPILQAHLAQVKEVAKQVGVDLPAARDSHRNDGKNDRPAHDHDHDAMH